VALLLVAGLLLSFGKFRWSARGLGLIGVVLLMFVLWAVHEQTISWTPELGVRMPRYRHSTRVRVLSLAALICLPVGAAVVMSSVFRSIPRLAPRRGPPPPSRGRPR